MLSSRLLVRTAIILGVAAAIALAQLMVPSEAFAAEPLQNAPMIFDVRISLPLEPDEPTYHDFYINAGPDAGFKKGMFINVVRPVPVHDPVQNKQQGVLLVNVARLHVIHVERSLTVARLHSEFSNDERPTLDFEAVMIGDRIDTASATMDPPNQKKKGRQTPAPKTKAEVKIEPKVESKVEAKVEADPATVQAPAPAPASVPAAAPPVQIPVPAAPAAVPQPSGPTRSTSTAVPYMLLADAD